MTNPINSLGIKLQYYQRDLAEVQGKYNNLKIEHSRMVKDAVETEKNLDELKDSVSRMCNGCSKKLSQDCDSCPLHNIAIKFNLWG